MKTCILVFAITISSFFTTFGQETLNISTSRSTIHWTGDYTFYFGGHNGTINFKDGYFVKSQGAIIGGNFTIDMTSIICLDVETVDGKNGLVDHLKDSDFFDVAKFPTAKLSITKVAYYDSNHMKIHADMTIKGITKPISFQAEVDYEKKQMTTKFKIDRMLWGINYNSKMRDGAISDAIGFDVTLTL